MAEQTNANVTGIFLVSAAPDFNEKAKSQPDPEPEPETWQPNGFQPQYEDLATDLSNTLKPLTEATITVRVIKSFEYRTFKALVLKDLNLEAVSVEELMEMVRRGEWARSVPAPSPLHLVVQNPAVGWKLCRKGADSDVAMKSTPGFKPYRTVQLGEHTFNL